MKLKTILTSTAVTAALSLTSHAALVTDWTFVPTNATFGSANLDTASPIIGIDASTDQGGEGELYASLSSTLSLVNVGDTITLSGSVKMDGIPGSMSRQIRFALYNSNSADASTTGNYIVTAASSTTSALYKRVAGTDFASTGSQTVLIDDGANGPNFVDGATYDFQLTLKLLAGGDVSITSSLNDGTNEYAGMTYTDTSSPITNVNSVGFLFGGSSDLNLGTFENVDVTYTAAVPEPSATSLIGLAGLGMILRRRR